MSGMTEIPIGEIEEQKRYMDRVREASQARPSRPLAYVDTYGCQQNEADSEKVRGMLREMGYGFTGDEFEADVIVINTCAIRENAENRVLGNVGALVHTKKAKRSQLIAFCGCLAGVPETVEKIRQSYRHVDLVFSPEKLWRFPEMLHRALSAKGRVFDTEIEDGMIAEGLPSHRDGTVKAWLPIMYGCNNFCSYCIVPYVRGRERSRAPEAILDEARSLVALGYKDVTLLGQNVNSYGGVCHGGGSPDTNFAALIRKINDIDGEFLIRFMTSHPKDASIDLFRAMAESEKAARHIHLPFQAGSDRILKLMNRGYTQAGYLEKVAAAREIMPDIVITSDVIVGFPGETEEEFEDTLRLVEKAQFDAMFTFIYSKRPGTPAAKLKDAVTRDEKQVRFDRLIDLQNAISEEKHSRHIGKTVRVLVDGESHDERYPLKSRTNGGRLVHLIGAPNLVGSFADARITHCNSWSLFGEVCQGDGSPDTKLRPESRPPDARIRIYRSGGFAREITCAPGETLLHRLNASGIFIDAPCGGKGKCGKCLVRLSPDGEQVRACRVTVDGDIDVYLPEEPEMSIAESGDVINTKPVLVGTAAASLRTRLGVAVDIGTTTVVAHLTNMTTGARIATASAGNAQRPYGADVVSRIQYCAENGHEELTRIIRKQVGALIRQACAASGERARDISYISVAGNTVMEHLTAGFSPVSMGTAPFTPQCLFGFEFPAWEGLPASKSASVYFAPAISSFVGGDITAGMLAAGLEESDGPAVYIDIGTNGEIAVKSGDIYYCCAAAAGPAFEGAEIMMGMAPVSGAVSQVKWDGGLDVSVIGDAGPRGLCGSGLIDALAVLLETGAVDETGRLLDADEIDHGIAAHIEKIDGKNIFRLTKKRGVYISAMDIRKLQLAKSAIAAGIQTLLNHTGITEDQVKLFVLAGGFGNRMDQFSAARIGLFPKKFLPVAQASGNTAGEGAALALCSESARDALENIRKRCEYIELSSNPVFNEEFITQMEFPAY